MISRSWYKHPPKKHRWTWSDFPTHWSTRSSAMAGHQNEVYGIKKNDPPFLEFPHVSGQIYYNYLIGFFGDFNFFHGLFKDKIPWKIQVVWPNGIIFHQPRFPWTKGSPPKSYFLGTLLVGRETEWNTACSRPTEMIDLKGSIFQLHHCWRKGRCWNGIIGVSYEDRHSTHEDYIYTMFS